jgi:hypothetical protein
MIPVALMAWRTAGVVARTSSASARNRIASTSTGAAPARKAVSRAAPTAARKHSVTNPEGCVRRQRWTSGRFNNSVIEGSS